MSVAVNKWDWHCLGCWIQKVHRILHVDEKGGGAWLGRPRISTLTCLPNDIHSLIAWSWFSQWDVNIHDCLPFQAAVLGICLLAMAGAMERCLFPLALLCGVLQGCVTLCDFLYGSALSRECCGVSNLVVLWIQSRTAFDYLESNTKKSIQRLSLYFCKEPHSWIGFQELKRKKNVGVQYITFTNALEIFIWIIKTPFRIATVIKQNVFCHFSISFCWLINLLISSITLE